MAIRYQGQNYRVVEAEYHPGQGEMSGAAQGTFWEHSFRSDLKLDAIAVERQTRSSHLVWNWASGSWRAAR
jgi:hypothetical protein